MPRNADETRVQDALRAAQLYYVQDQTMESIATELHTSRSTVSRLLSQAREAGLVTIEVRSPFDTRSGLEAQLTDRYGVTAHVVPAPATISDIDRLERVAMTAARLLNGFFDSAMTMGIAWGSTMSAISRHLVPKDTHNTRIVQLNGAGSMESSGVDYASEILQRFGAAYSARVNQFPVPAFFDDPLTREAVWRERSTRRVLEIQSRVDVALFSLGSPFAEVPSHVYIGGYLEKADYSSLARDRVVGDVATVFFRADGSCDGIALNARATGPDFARLKKIARRVCVVSGPLKAASVHGALSAGIVTDLILDEALARRLVGAE